MGKLIQKLLDSMKLNDEDDDYDEDDFETKPEPERVRRESVEKPVRKYESRRSAFEDDEDDEEEAPVPVRRSSSIREERPVTRQPQSSGRTMVPMRSVSGPSDICIFHPKRFEDSQEICDMLKEGRVVFVNFEALGAENGQRIMDFISGAVYSLDANIHQISNFNFVIAPDKVEITGDYIDSLKSGTFEVPVLGR